MSIVRKVICSAKAPKAIGPYSQAVQVNHMLHVSGQLGLNPETGEFVSDCVKEQTQQVMTNMKNILEEAGIMCFLFMLVCGRFSVYVMSVSLCQGVGLCVCEIRGGLREIFY